MVFALKYRRKTFYGERRCKTGKILGKLCGMEVMSVSGFAGFLNGKSGLTVLERWNNVSQQKIPVQRILSAGTNARKIAEYLQNQLKEDALSDRLTQDLSASFTGGKQRKASAGALYAV